MIYKAPKSQKEAQFDSRELRHASIIIGLCALEIFRLIVRSSKYCKSESYIVQKYVFQ